jgi:DNA repair ATPase RecN
MKAAGILELLLTCSLALAAPCAGQRTVTQPSLGELARKVRAERAKENLKNVPLYTNDNLPAGPAVLGVIGTSSPAGGGARVEEGSSAVKEKMAELRYNLSQARQRLQIDQRELAVYQKELGQGNIQYYPNPSETLIQQYNRSNINKLTQQIQQKQQQIADDQQAVSNLESELQSAEADWGWLAPASGAATAPPASPPILAKPGTRAYWQQRLQAAHQELAKAKELEKLGENELRLLKVQQVQTLNPNLQASLGAAISAKQSEVTEARENVQKAQQELEELQTEMQASGAAQ